MTESQSFKGLYFPIDNSLADHQPQGDTMVDPEGVAARHFSLPPQEARQKGVAN